MRRPSAAIPQAFEPVIMQLVDLTRGRPARAQVSKRAGAIVAPSNDLLDDVFGADAAAGSSCSSAATRPRSTSTSRWRSAQSAQTRTRSTTRSTPTPGSTRILAQGRGGRVAAALAADVAASAEQLHPSARALVKRLAAFPGEVVHAADRRAPHRMTTYVTELAQDFSAFYRDCKVVGAAEEGGDEDLRIALSEATRRTIARSLDLLGVSAPSEM